ncbi:MAG TPA: hypothetical protein VFD48_13785 [Pyrinomonadaceae bacterium]|nr:hypothetical protein [Pyrinomonadaceae bacterium]
MSDLEKHLNQLVSFMKGWGAPSSWSRVLFIEDTSITRGMPSLIPRSSLIPLADYAARFDSHLDEGHSWINMSAAGILDDALLVVIELPGYKNNVPRDKVSVNFSGAAMVNGKAQWDASGRHRIID